jgi:hypothetical protein
VGDGAQWAMARFLHFDYAQWAMARFLHFDYAQWAMTTLSGRWELIKKYGKMTIL